jgi:ADP-ribose pyrophosphatase YjhB (NUDIX family)
MNIGKDYIGVSAGAVIFDSQHKKIFMSKRGDMARDDQGLWEFPGGSVNMFEARADAVKRILKLKHGIDIEIESTLGVYDVIDEGPQNDHWLSTTYICKKVGGEEKILHPGKCSSVGWFSTEEIKLMNISRITALNFQDILKTISI